MGRSKLFKKNTEQKTRKTIETGGERTEIPIRWINSKVGGPQTLLKGTSGPGFVRTFSRDWKKGCTAQRKGLVRWTSGRVKLNGRKLNGGNLRIEDGQGGVGYTWGTALGIIQAGPSWWREGKWQGMAAIRLIGHQQELFSSKEGRNTMSWGWNRAKCGKILKVPRGEPSDKGRSH